MDATLRIKNLSIALEAISSAGTSLKLFNIASRITSLLEVELEQEETKMAKTPPARPADLTSHDTDPF